MVTLVEEDRAITSFQRLIIIFIDTSDLHFVCKSDGVTGRNLVKNDLAFLWCGVQANHGVKSGKVCYECKVSVYSYTV